MCFCMRRSVAVGALSRFLLSGVRYLCSSFRSTNNLCDTWCFLWLNFHVGRWIFHRGHVSRQAVIRSGLSLRAVKTCALIHELLCAICSTDGGEIQNEAPFPYSSRSGELCVVKFDTSLSTFTLQVVAYVFGSGFCFTPEKLGHDNLQMDMQCVYVIWLFTGRMRCC